MVESGPMMEIVLYPVFKKRNPFEYLESYYGEFATIKDEDKKKKAPLKLHKPPWWNQGLRFRVGLFLTQR